MNKIFENTTNTTTKNTTNGMKMNSFNTLLFSPHKFFNYSQKRTLKGVKDVLDTEINKKQPEQAPSPPPPSSPSNKPLPTIRWYHKGKFVSPLLLVISFSLLYHAYNSVEEKENMLHKINNENSVLWNHLNAIKEENASN